MKPLRMLAVPLLAGMLALTASAQTFSITDFEAFPAPSAKGTVMSASPLSQGLQIVSLIQR